jgi:catechol 2,3-dioxygenase-like lactoylglutathione lyase family enzyme
MTAETGPWIGAVALIVPDYDAAIQFFCAIGFVLRADINQGHKRWVCVQPKQGGTAFILARAEGAAQTADSLVPKGSGTSTKFRIASAQGAGLVACRRLRTLRKRSGRSWGSKGPS